MFLSNVREFGAKNVNLGNNHNVANNYNNAKKTDACILVNWALSCSLMIMILDSLIIVII